MDKLKADIEKKFPEAEILTRKADDPKGFRFLNIYQDDIEIGIEWKPNVNFGLSQWIGQKNEISGMYHPPREWYKTHKAVYHRVCSILSNK